jgi:hypothetical protein
MTVLLPVAIQSFSFLDFGPSRTTVPGLLGVPWAGDFFSRVSVSPTRRAQSFLPVDHRDTVISRRGKQGRLRQITRITPWLLHSLRQNSWMPNPVVGGDASSYLGRTDALPSWVVQQCQMVEPLLVLGQVKCLIPRRHDRQTTIDHGYDLQYCGRQGSSQPPFDRADKLGRQMG